MSDFETTDLLQFIRNGKIKKVTKIIEKLGLSYAKEWAGGFVLLREAVKANQPKIAKMLLNHGAEINMRTKRPGYTPLHYAVKNNDTEMVKILLVQQANVNTKSGLGNITPLHSAVSVGNVNIVESLLNANAIVDSQNSIDETPIELAISQGKMNIIKLLIEKGARIDTKSSNGITALHLAVKSGEESVVTHLLNHGADINSTRPNSTTPGYTPLHHASAAGHKDIVKLLLSRGADINSTTGEMYTALHIATKNQRGKIVKMLLKRDDTDVKARDQIGKTILHIALENCDLAIIEIILNTWTEADNQNYRKCIRDAVCMNWPNDEIFRKAITILREHGFSVRLKDAQDPTFLHIVVSKGCVEVLEDLLKMGANVNSIYEKGYTLLHNAVDKKQLEIAKLLIKNNANVNAEVNGDKTPIWGAIDKSDIDMVMLLLDNGTDLRGCHYLLHKALRKGSRAIVELLLMRNSEIDINARDKAGRTPLCYAIVSHDIYHRSVENNNDDDIKCYFVKLLLSQGAMVNIQDNDGISPLHRAVDVRNLKIVEILLKHNANVNSATTINKETPLHWSVQNEEESIIELLLDNGADINAKRIDGKTPLHVACEKCRKNIVSTLLKFGADIDSRDNDAMTPLRIVMMNDDSLEIVQILMNHFVNVEIRDNDGMTPLHAASKNGQPEIVKELLNYGSNTDVTCKRGHTPLFYAFSNVSEIGSNDGDNDNSDGHRHGSDDEYEEDDSHRNDDDYDDDDASSRTSARLVEVAKILQQHIQKIRALNFPINGWDSSVLDRIVDLKDFYDRCKYEIDIMMNGKINNTNVSLFDILTKDINQLAMYTRNENIRELLELGSSDDLFPIYHDMIHNNLEKGEKRSSLLNSGQKSLNFLSCFSLPAPWSLDVLSKLSNKDLQSLTRAGGYCESNEPTA